MLNSNGNGALVQSSGNLDKTNNKLTNSSAEIKNNNSGSNSRSTNNNTNISVNKFTE